MSIEENAVEQITVNPDQTAQVVKNEDRFETVPQLNVAVFDPSVVTTKTNKTLNDLDDWKEFLHDPWKAMESGEERFEKYKPVADLSRDPVWYALTQKYGRDIVNKTDTILDYYRPAGNVFARTINAHNYSADNLKLSEARKRLSDATMAGDTTKAKEIENEIAELKYRLANRDMPFKSEGLNSLMDVSASAARNLPEVIAINIGSAAAAIPTAGVSVPAGRIASAGVVYNDTYNLEFGATLHEIMSANPSLPEAEARKIASRVANRNALIEAAPMLIPGLDFLAGTGKRIAGVVTNKAAREGFKLLAQRNPAAVKKVLAETAKLLGSIGIEVGSESFTEMWQEIGSAAAVEAATTGRDVGDITDERIMAFVRDPFSEENATLWETFGYTAEGVLGFEAITRALTGVGGHVAGRVRSGRTRPATTEEKATGATANATLADRLFRHRQESEVATQSPELTDRANQAMVDRGVVPEKIYFDKDMVEQLLGDSSVQQAVRDLELQQAYEDSRNNGGVVEVDFTKYDSVVNTNEELFQRIKNAISFSPETLSLNQFQAYLDSLDAKGMGEIERARQSTDSLYNRVYNLMMQLHNDEKLAQAQAIQAQFMANRIGAFRVGQPRTGEDAASQLEIRIVGQPTTGGLNQLITYRGEQRDLFNDVYTAAGKQVKYMGLDGKYTTGVNRAAITDDSSVKVIKMSPREFLSLTPYQMGSRDVSKLEGVINNGGEIAMPFLTVKVEDPEKKTLRVIGHEGRHRSLAMQNLGAARGYTVLESKDFYRQPELFKDGIAGWKILPQEGALYEDRSFDIEGDARGSVGETITVDGIERPTRNSEGNLIAENEESLTNFWRWFGDSKVVDEQGRPLVVYHGTDTEFEAFDKGRIGKNAAKLGGGFYTTNVEREAGGYGKAIALYASIKNPINTETFSKNISQEDRQKLYDYLKPYCSLDKGFRDNLTGDDDSFLHDLYFDIDYQVRNEKYFEALKSVLGADGVINYVKGTDNTYEFVAFDNTQLKRTDNLGTWSPTDERMLHQFVGSTDTDKLNAVADALGKRKELDEARAMYDEATSRGDMPDYEDIWAKTGWYYNEDGSWSYEISDAESDLDTKPFVNSRGNVESGVHTKLGKIWDNEELYKIVPWAKDIYVHVGKSNLTDKVNSSGSIAKWVARPQGSWTLHEIIVNAAALKRAMERGDTVEHALKSEIVHELQHAIQYELDMMYTNNNGSQIKQPEGLWDLTPEQKDEIKKLWELRDRVNEFVKEHGIKLERETSGINALYGNRNRIMNALKTDEEKQVLNEFVDKFNETKDYNFFADSDYYRRTHELQARNSQYRLGLSAEQRRIVSPSATKDIAGETRVGYAANPSQLRTQTREIRVIKFAGMPVEDAYAQRGQAEPQAPKTGGGQVIAGSFFREGDKFVIQLTADANPTTFSHELFHWFSREMQDAYNSGQMTDYWKGKAETLAKMVDAKLEVDPVDPTVTRLNLTTAQEERAADMFLEYLREGKVENESVRPLFAYIQTLFKSVFKLLGLRELKLNKESEELFGAIFRAQDVIEDEQRLAGILAIEKPEGADQGLYDMYVGEMLNSRVRGTQELYKKLFAIDKFRKSNEYEKIQSMTRLDVAEQLNSEVRYIVVDEAAKHDNNAQATWLALQTNPDTADIELSVQQVQEILDNTPDKTTEIDRITEQRMNEYVQNRFKITPEEMGLKASRNSSKVKALLAESLMRDGKTIQDFDAAYKDLLAAADDQVAKSSLHRLADKNYWDTLESRAVERYAFALANNDNKVMTETRRDQAIVNAIRMRAEAITNRARRFQEAAEAFRGAQQKIAVKGEDGKKARSEYKYGAYDYDLLQSILEKFGFDINYARRRPIPVGEKMDNWITEQEATTLTRAGELRNFIPFINDGHDGTFTSMTGADFEKLDAVFNAIKSVAGARYAIVLEKERLMLSEMVSATAQKFKNMGISAFDKKDGYWAKHFGTLASWTNPEPIVRNLFPDAALKNVWLPFIDAAVRAERYGSQWVDRYRAAKGKVDLSNKAREYSTGHRLSNKQVADLLLSMGNEHAYENFRMAYGLDEAQAETIVSEALTAQPALADFAKEVWATYGDATTQLDKEFEARTNTLFVEKSHREFEINGIKFGGGYVPVRKQLDYVPTDVRAGNQGGMVHDKKFEKLVVAQADGNVRSIVDITENELFQSAKQAYTAVEYNNARKLLLADGMRETIGERAFSFLDGWLASYMMPKYDTTAWVRPLATLSSMGALGFRASTAILQLSGLVPAAIAVGPKYFARGLHMAMKNGEWAPVMATRKGANKSDYMAVRIGDPRSSLLGQSIVDAVRAQDATTTFGKTAQYLLTKVGNAAMWGIQQIDTAVANVTWNGAYLKALDKGMSEIEARREADSVVRTVQSDSMQISRSEALQTPMARMFTAFATWIMAMQSQIRADFATRQFTHAAVWGAAYMILSPIFESFLKEALRLDVLLGADDDDEEYIDRVLKTCYNEISSTAGTTIIPPASIGGAALTAILSGIEEGITGEKNYFDARESNVPALQTAYRGINAARYGVAGILSGDTEKLGKAATYGASTISTEAGRLVKILLAE